MFFQLGSNFLDCRIIHINMIMLMDHLSIVPHLPLAAHIDLKLAQGKLQRAKGSLQHILIHVFHKAHALLPVPIGGVPLHGDVLGQVLIRIILVAKARANIIHLLEPGPQQALKRQLVANPQVELLAIQRIHVGHKRVGIRPTGGVLEHRHIDLSKAMLVEVIARRLPERAAAVKALAHRRVNIHIHIAAAEALFFILQLFGQWPQGFGQQPQLAHPYRNLTRLRPQHRTRRFHKVARIE